jgi:hypothetical protein
VSRSPRNAALSGELRCPAMSTDSIALQRAWAPTRHFGRPTWTVTEQQHPPPHSTGASSPAAPLGMRPTQGLSTAPAGIGTQTIMLNTRGPSWTAANGSTRNQEPTATPAALFGTRDVDDHCQAPAVLGCDRSHETVQMDLFLYTLRPRIGRYMHQHLLSSQL